METYNIDSLTLEALKNRVKEFTNSFQGQADVLTFYDSLSITKQTDTKQVFEKIVSKVSDLLFNFIKDLGLERDDKHSPEEFDKLLSKQCNAFARSIASTLSDSEHVDLYFTLKEELDC